MSNLSTTTEPDSGDYPPLSALNDLLFCPRRCFLHRIEGVWIENVHTVSGSLNHKRVHSPADSDESHFRITRGLRLVSHKLRVVGIADVVEFHPDPHGGPDIPFPVEYKRGKKRRWDNDEAQVCAQALCLEEMTGIGVPAGAIFHVKSKRRQIVPFDDALRRLTLEAANQLHQLLQSNRAPLPVVHPKCKKCSLYKLCLPELIQSQDHYQDAYRNLFKIL